MNVNDTRPLFGILMMCAVCSCANGAPAPSTTPSAAPSAEPSTAPSTNSAVVAGDGGVQPAQRDAGVVSTEPRASRPWFDGAAAEQAIRALDFRPCFATSSFQVPEAKVDVTFLPTGSVQTAPVGWKVNANESDAHSAQRCLSHLLGTVRVPAFREIQVHVRTQLGIDGVTVAWTKPFVVERTLAVADRPGCTPPWTIDGSGQKHYKRECTDHGF